MKVEELLRLAQAGDAEAREELLRSLQPLILRVASQFRRRPITWSDEEAGVALRALNEAVDQYDSRRGVPFLLFARQVMRSRLIDFCRREKTSWVSLEEADSREESAEIAWERREEIERYVYLLSQFGLSLDDLARSSPRHQDTRARFLYAAVKLVESEDLFRQVLNDHRLPLKELAELTGIPRKTLERGRRYLLAVSLILGFPEEFCYLYSYIKDIFPKEQGEK
ncbi:sigma-70 family RNA polymerase sigma factor [Desulfothermobacter acidiphilus]|uniref:sigma-70 family RNA polymerase sigma factor n=1 Tax=Desulfothermobacter acidiphilus TaxID=1938353 RepID=UPI003F8BFB06